MPGCRECRGEVRGAAGHAAGWGIDHARATHVLAGLTADAPNGPGCSRPLALRLRSGGAACSGCTGTRQCPPLLPPLLTASIVRRSYSTFCTTCRACKDLLACPRLCHAAARCPWTPAGIRGLRKTGVLAAKSATMCPGRPAHQLHSPCVPVARRRLGAGRCARGRCAWAA